MDVVGRTFRSAEAQGARPRRTREEDTTNDDQGTDERPATHEPVLLEEALQFLQPERGGVFVLLEAARSG